MVIENDHYQSIGIVCLSVIRGRSSGRSALIGAVVLPQNDLPHGHLQRLFSVTTQPIRPTPNLAKTDDSQWLTPLFQVSNIQDWSSCHLRNQAEGWFFGLLKNWGGSPKVMCTYWANTEKTYIQNILSDLCLHFWESGVGEKTYMRRCGNFFFCPTL